MRVPGLPQLSQIIDLLLIHPLLYTRFKQSYIEGLDDGERCVQIELPFASKVIVSPRFGAIAAVVHRAPTAAVIFARIDKEPAAGIVLTFAYACQIIRGQ